LIVKQQDYDQLYVVLVNFLSFSCSSLDWIHIVDYYYSIDCSWSINTWY